MTINSSIRELTQNPEECSLWKLFLCVCSQNISGFTSLRPQRDFIKINSQLSMTHSLRQLDGKVPSLECHWEFPGRVFQVASLAERELQSNPSKPVAAPAGCPWAGTPPEPHVGDKLPLSGEVGAFSGSTQGLTAQGFSSPRMPQALVTRPSHSGTRRFLPWWKADLESHSHSPWG